ncbi:helix-turn-helix domain-containing protein [Coprococcus sp. AF21-14LB]
MEEIFQGMEYIYEVYKEKSFSKAARKLFISQPL